MTYSLPDATKFPLTDLFRAVTLSLLAVQKSTSSSGGLEYPPLLLGVPQVIPNWHVGWPTPIITVLFF